MRYTGNVHFDHILKMCMKTTVCSLTFMDKEMADKLPYFQLSSFRMRFFVENLDFYSMFCLGLTIKNAPKLYTIIFYRVYACSLASLWSLRSIKVLRKYMKCIVACFRSVLEGLAKSLVCILVFAIHL